MNRLLLTCYRDTLHKYQKFQSRFEKTLSNGSFGHLPLHKRTVILTRLSRLRARIANFQHQYSLFAAGSALLATLGANVEGHTQGLPVPVKSNFQVNTITVDLQTNAAVAKDDDGDFVIVWQDRSSTTNSHDIYMRRYDAAGKPLDNEDILVNTNYRTEHQINPAVAMDADGDFAITWYSREQQKVYARLYNAQGIPQREIIVNVGDAAGAEISTAKIRPAIAMDADGDFAVTWQSNSQDGSGYGIYMRTYTKAGTPTKSKEQEVNTYTTNDQTFPGIAMDDVGNFVIVWQGQGNGDINGIYAKRYSAAGTPQGNEFLVNETTTGNQQLPAIARTSSGDFIIAWTSEDGLNGDVFARRYNSAGTGKEAKEFRVNSFITDSQSKAAIAVDEKGNFIITWQGQGDGDTEGIYARHFASNGKAEGNEVIVNTFTTNSQSKPAVAVDAIGNFIIAWSSSDQDGSGEGTYAQQFTLSTIERRVTAQTIGQVNNIATAMDTSGAYVVVWRRQENGFSQAHIYGQIYNAAGVVQGDAFKINTSPSTFDKEKPDVAMEANGDFVVVWQSNNQDGSEWGIYARRFNAEGSPLSPEFQVNTYTTNSQIEPAIAMDSDGDFVISWQSYGQDNDSNSNTNVYAKKYNNIGGVQKDEFRVNSITKDSQHNADVAMDGDGDFVITWHSIEDSGSDSRQFIYAKRFNRLGEVQGPGSVEFVVREEESSATAFQLYPAVAMNAGGEFVIIWDSDRGSLTVNGYNIYARIYDANGSIKSEVISINSRWRGAEKDNRYPDIAMDVNGNFTAVWSGLASTTSGSYDGSCNAVIAKRYNSSGNEISPEFLVNTYTIGNQDSPAIAMSPAGNFVIAWRSENHCQPGQTHAQKGVFHRLFHVPTTITLSKATVPENQAGATVGSFTTTDATNGDTFTYTPAAANDNTDDDNNIFIIENNLLKIKPTDSLNYEVKSTYRVRIRTTDASGLFFERAFVITVTDVNEDPTNITLSANKVYENRPVKTVIGNLTTSDPDASNTHRYSLVTGFGDNGSFIIEDDTLKTNVSFNFETKSTYSVRIRTTDTGGLPFEKVFTIEILHINDRPTLDSISSQDLKQNIPIQTVELTGITSSGEETGQTITLSYQILEGNQNLISNVKVNYTSPAATGNIQFAPNPNQSGQVKIRVTVQDNGGTANGGINSISRDFTIKGAPTIPGNLKAEVDAQNRKIVLSWDDSSGEDIYYIERSVGGESNFTEIDNVGKNFTTYDDNKDIQDSTLYFYRIRASYNALDSYSEVTGVMTAEPLVVNLEKFQQKTIKLFPNPATDYVVMNLSAFSALSITSASLEVYTAKGQSIWSGEWAGKNQAIIPVSHWKAGSYLLVLSVGNQKITKQFIKY